VLFCLPIYLDGLHCSNTSTQAPLTAAHSQCFAGYSFGHPRHTSDKETDVVGGRYAAYLGGPPKPAGTSNVRSAHLCCQNALLRTSSTRPSPIILRNRTERASGLCFVWELAVLFCLPM